MREIPTTVVLRTKVGLILDGSILSQMMTWLAMTTMIRNGSTSSLLVRQERAQLGIPREDIIHSMLIWYHEQTTGMI